jgi:hypothetical protein
MALLPCHYTLLHAGRMPDVSSIVKHHQTAERRNSWVYYQRRDDTCRGWCLSLSTVMDLKRWRGVLCLSVPIRELQHRLGMDEYSRSEEATLQRGGWAKGPTHNRKNRTASDLTDPSQYEDEIGETHSTKDLGTLHIALNSLTTPIITEWSWILSDSTNELAAAHSDSSESTTYFSN